MLAFVAGESMVVSMANPWFRKLFSQSQTSAREVPLADSDCADAGIQYGLGLKFANGEGAARSYEQAADWYRKAADQNHSLAQFNLGMMYACGQGMPQDDAQSVVWFNRAARLGDAGAQFKMGGSCHRASFGRRPDAGTARAVDLESKIEAYKWYRLAGAQGYQGAVTACESLTLDMTREDIAAGNQRMADFKVDPPKPDQN
jgi:TPR repeat protein